MPTLPVSTEGATSADFDITRAADYQFLPTREKGIRGF